MPDLVFLGQPGSVTGEDDKHLSTWCQRGLARLQHGWVLPVVEQQVTEDDHVKPPTFQTSQQRRGIRTPEIALSSQPNIQLVTPLIASKKVPKKTYLHINSVTDGFL